MNFADEIKSSFPPPRRQQKEAYFAEISAPLHEIKEDLLLRYIFPKHGKNGEDFFGMKAIRRLGQCM